jgi:hypothetical protein
VFLLAILLGLSSVDVERLDAALREPRLNGNRPKDLAFKITISLRGIKDKTKFDLQLGRPPRRRRTSAD